MIASSSRRASLAARRALLACTVLCWAIGALGGTARGQAPPPQSNTDARPDPQAEARTRFQRGMAFMRDEAWDSALAEFARSRELYPTKGNSKNAAYCLEKLRRFDEALELSENLLTEFSDWSASERNEIVQEITRLRSQTGIVEIVIGERGATVMIDGRIRGVTPLSAVRVSVGSHVVRLYKEGYLPFERQLDVASQERKVVEGVIAPLTSSGRLRVTERNQRTADVLVDNVRVGTTPWDGPLAIGNHLVVLRATDGLGTEPALAPVRRGESTALTLALEHLDAELRVQPTPSSALVALDGVPVGRGVWEGPVRSGKHRVEVAAEGFLPARREVVIGPNQRELALIELERDTRSPLWQSAAASAVAVDARFGFAIAPSIGGDLTAACSTPCSKSLALGGVALVDGGYRFSSGFGLALEAGYLFLHQELHNRIGALNPYGLLPNAGTIDDSLRVSGLLAGASVSLRKGSTWTFLGRLGGGVLLGSLRDSRSGTFTTNRSPIGYSVGPIDESPLLSYVYVAPELHMGYRFGAHIEVGVALQGLLFVALSQPTWKDEVHVLAGACSSTSMATCEGDATFGSQKVAGETFVALAPGIELALSF